MQIPKNTIMMPLGMLIFAIAVNIIIGVNGSVSTAFGATPAPLTLTAVPVQNKILKGSDGRLSVWLTLSVSEIDEGSHQQVQPVDLVMVLDRSGSMNGRKITHARKAIMLLLDQLTANDRLALVTYANDVKVTSPLVYVNRDNRNRLKRAVRQVCVGGGTNLGGGLQQGIDLVSWDRYTHRQRKVILISDGLANHGITDPFALGDMASTAPGRNATISTVGVGLDFNEMLMTTIADHGAGQYHFLEDPACFAQVFEKEFQKTMNVAAAKIEIIITLKDGVQLLDAGGYPVIHGDGNAVIQPGNLASGGKRSFFLTFKVPVDQTDDIRIGDIKATYRHKDKKHSYRMPKSLDITCIDDPIAVQRSIDKDAWSRHVVQEGFSKLKNEVAAAIRKGDKQLAKSKIRSYEVRNQAINDKVGSKRVQQNLDEEVKILGTQVDSTFIGAPAQVAEKKKKNAKALQYDSYKIRRDKQ